MPTLKSQTSGTEYMSARLLSLDSQMADQCCVTKVSSLFSNLRMCCGRSETDMFSRVLHLTVCEMFLWHQIECAVAIPTCIYFSNNLVQ